MNGFISEIQRFSLHDGPGIRTTVFLKGCQLKCAWCHNPETISTGTQILYFDQRCSSCGRCRQACPVGIDRAKSLDGNCVKCGGCVEVCPTGALQLSETTMSVDDVLSEVLEDSAFYGKDGGITVSGGEPVLQSEFVGSLLQECCNNGINTAIETNLCYPWSKLETLLPYLDVVMFDIKIWDDVKHLKYTSGSNKLIKENIAKLAETSKKLIARTPLIKGISDSLEEIDSIAEYLSNLKNLEYYELLNYHNLGVYKNEALGLKAEVFSPPDVKRQNDLVDIVKKHSIRLKIDGQEK